MGHLLVFGCGNLGVFHEFKVGGLFKIMFDSDGVGMSISAEGNVHGVTLLQGFSDSFLGCSWEGRIPVILEEGILGGILGFLDAGDSFIGAGDKGGSGFIIGPVFFTNSVRGFKDKVALVGGNP